MSDEKMAVVDIEVLAFVAANDPYYGLAFALTNCSRLIETVRRPGPIDIRLSNKLSQLM